MPVRISVMPGDGAVWPAIVRIRLGDLDLVLREVDDAADFEHDDARAVGFERCEQRARSARRQRRDAQDLAAAPARRVRGRSPARRGRRADRRRPRRVAPGSAAVSSSDREQIGCASCSSQNSPELIVCVESGNCK